ncbi:TPA: hypothetical protein ACRZGX_001840 [Escherichia coli]
MAESVKQICLTAHIITVKKVPEYIKLAKIKTLLKIADKKSPA